MFRLLRRLLLWGFLLLAAIWVVSRLLNREEDFDDYDDIDMGMDFMETPVEIDVPAESAPTKSNPTKPLSMPDTTSEATTETKATSETDAKSADGQIHSLIDVNGIGPTYAARLNDVGITTLDDLAKAAPETLAEKIEVIGGHTEIEDWIKQAREMTSGGK